MTIHATILLTSAGLTVARPILQYGICPALTMLENQKIDDACQIVVQSITIASTTIGTAYGVYTILSNPPVFDCADFC